MEFRTQTTCVLDVAGTTQVWRVPPYPAAVLCREHSSGEVISSQAEQPGLRVKQLAAAND